MARAEELERQEKVEEAELRRTQTEPDREGTLEAKRRTP
jgi:hypothetical protein